MNLTQMIQAAGGGQAVGQMARELGIGESDARGAMDKLMPALARGLQRNAGQSGGLEQLLGVLGSGRHQEYLDNPEKLGKPETLADGNAILGHIFGSKDVSRNVAGRAAEETGLDSGVLKKMLPMLAALAMGGLSKQTQKGGALDVITQASTGRSQGGGSDALGALGSLLDSDGDGEVVDDLLNLAKRFF